VRRPDPDHARGKPDPTVTSVGWACGIGGYLRQLGIDRDLHARFDRLKSDLGSSTRWACSSDC